ncbi:hypothetical protein CA984_12470 [Streptosporangium minutum]|uniref:Uncharacterized protein n=1 Tax=Streptosporangium minutum TaxID=569862 RepID=A0A243RS15_9ACTN|nr:hypothetical protein CA984_12470 [Streptosporangium minutum]
MDLTPASWQAAAPHLREQASSPRYAGLRPTVIGTRSHVAVSCANLVPWQGCSRNVGYDYSGLDRSMRERLEGVSRRLDSG